MPSEVTVKDIETLDCSQNSILHVHELNRIVFLTEIKEIYMYTVLRQLGAGCR